MEILIVYGSQYGNTQRVGQALGAALAAEHSVRVVQAAVAGGVRGEGVDLLFVGAPTQMRGSRMLAGAFLDGLADRGFRSVPAAAFDTRMGDPPAAHVASTAIDRRLRDAGCPIAAPPESFTVTDVEGPLAQGEIRRAGAWARSVADAVAART